MTPQGLWYRFHVNAHEHPKVIRLRALAGPRADAACWGWFGIIVAAAKRYGAWAFADEAHLEHIAGRYYRFVEIYREVGLLDGLTVHDGETYNTPKDPTAAERMRRMRASRDTGDERNDRNTVTPRAEQSRTEQSVSRPRAREGIDDIPDEVLDAWSEATGRTVLASGDFAIGVLSDTCRRHGGSRVAAAIAAARETFDHIPAVQPLATAVRNRLDPLPNSKDTQRAEAEKREEIRSRKAVEATIRKAHETGFHEKQPDPRCPLCP